MAAPTKKMYLDYAATTPVDARVLRAMEPYFSEKFGNPGSLHSFGQEAIAAVDRAREVIANAIGADFREIIFTGSATEANNLALRGTFAATLKNSKKKIDHPRVIVSAIEHESVLEVARDFERNGIDGRAVDVVYLPLDRKGIVDLKKLKESLNDQTILVSIMHANNEIGSVQPISEIAKIIKNSSSALFHVDAAQSFQYFDCNVDELGVDLMTISSHKIYGPKGAGALYVRNQAGRNSILPLSSKLQALLLGGGQEFGFRSGTENVPAIVGFAKAVELTIGVREKEAKRIGVLRDELWRGIKKINAKTEVNGEEKGSGKDNGGKLPNILNVYFPNHAAQDLLTKFDLAGLAVSSGSACRSRAMESSYVIEALRYSKERAKSSIRFSLGRPTTLADIKKTLKIIEAALV